MTTNMCCASNYLLVMFSVTSKERPLKKTNHFRELAMADAKAVEERAVKIYGAYNWATSVDWVKRPEDLKDRYRALAQRELEEEAVATEKIGTS